ncbi:hypothetical protein BC835DRAFT_1303524 [Cytidiella melzeri]|nr:hypothetical protein BC835DRAFT_1303524 [Cytidiella melzeri]
MCNVRQEDLNNVDLVLGIVRAVVRADAQVAVKMGVNGVDRWLAVLARLWQEGWARDVLEKEVGGIHDSSLDSLSGWGSGVEELEETVIDESGELYKVHSGFSKRWQELLVAGSVTELEAGINKGEAVV